MSLRMMAASALLALTLLSTGGCAVTEVEAAWQQTHFSRSPDLADFSRKMEGMVKDWFPGIRQIPPAYADKVS